jgi:serine/threonine protein kinase
VTVQTGYQIGEIIGRGGMGEVRLADDVMLHRKVALKFVTEGGETDGLEQLLGEARAAAALDHPFICSIYEVTTIDGRACIAMEYVRGESLERRLRGGRLALAEALRVAEGSPRRSTRRTSGASCTATSSRRT